MIPLALAYTAMDQGEWGVAVGIAIAVMVACIVGMGGECD